MRRLTFLAAMTGILYVVDAYYFHGQYRGACLTAIPWTADRPGMSAGDASPKMDRALPNSTASYPRERADTARLNALTHSRNAFRSRVVVKIIDSPKNAN